ncbi:hypothetical protein BC939DRAFT_464006 [Gamsiella multidivaricata]|uniref:uncharacterized protein n=1 Tax=Gamsiella multidivaricata TaxID=101098 RepID=UPI00221EEFA3|nr:uncharacterized protein BC939DRAFT_464006 [Gamsiella multidivaricata]KAI7818103.1 hypothetical protein BC939DRAFT_464006 [Gamsiella multidivaricata]
MIHSHRNKNKKKTRSPRHVASILKNAYPWCLQKQILLLVRAIEVEIKSACNPGYPIGTLAPLSALDSVARFRHGNYLKTFLSVPSHYCTNA